MKTVVFYLGSKHEYAYLQYEKLCAAIDKCDVELITYDVQISGENQLTKDMLESNNLNAVILFVGTFFDGRVVAKLYNAFRDIPFYIHGIPEPEDINSDIVELNSWTGFNMATSFFKRYDKVFSYSFSALDEKDTVDGISNFINALKLKASLKKLKIGVIGPRAPGFYLSEADQLNLQKNSGITVEYFSLTHLLSISENIKGAQEVYEKLLKKGMSFCVAKDDALKMIKLYLACKQIAKENGLSGMSMRCWPEFEDIFSTTVCGVLSLLNDDGIIASCEGDILGVVTMIIQHKITGQIPFFADIVDVNKNNIKAWHCGHGATCLASGNVAFCGHPTYEEAYPTAVQYEMKLDNVTVCKLSEFKGNYSLLCEQGKSVPVNKKVKGIQTDIVLDINTGDFIDKVVDNGVEHHYSIIHAHIKNMLKECCKWMDWRMLD